MSATERIMIIAYFVVGTLGFVLLKQWLRGRRYSRAEHWPTAEGHIEKVESDSDSEAGFIVTLVYTYKVEGERYVGRERIAFDRDEKAGELRSASRNRRALIRYRPDKPQVSVFYRAL